MVRLVREENGMEMIEWSIVGVVFALAGALVWSTLNDDIGSALGTISSCVSDSTTCE
jgi:hypothetical protein